MQRPSSRREAQQQGARRIFVVRIIVNDLSLSARLPDFLFADVALDHAPESVTAEFKFSGGQLLLDL